jgi:Flp pilus assembly protein TadD
VHSYISTLKLSLVAATALAAALACARAASGDGGADASNTSRVPPLPPASEPFSPSNARTHDGGLIPSEQFFPAARCASCHKDTHEGWSESAHRNAGREPFYKLSVDLLQKQRGVEFTRHCESCHAPVALLSGALTTGSRESRAMDDEGVTCTVCHSMTEVRLDGTGSYTIRRPALLAREDGTPVFGDVPDAAIMADVAGHRRAVMRPLLQTPEFCASCHKSVAPPSLNGYKFLRGFSVYDEWQQSGASKETVQPFYRRAERADCNTCHMPAVKSANDRAATDGAVASHRWLGANTAAPLFYAQKKQVEETIRFLENKVLNVDIFAVRGEASGESVAPLAARADNALAVSPGEELTAEVVVANRKAGHSFPPELRDMYEPWVEFEVLDAVGQTVFHSGFVRADQTLDERAHVYKAILLDYEARPLTRHQVWLGTVKAYDNFINAGRSDVARFRFRVPKDVGAGRPLTLRARVNYRRFIQEYTDRVLERFRAKLTVPVVKMAETETRIVVSTAGQPRKETAGGTPRSPLSAPAPPAGPTPEQQARRWNDYGIGLLEQAQYGAAAEAFREAARLNPKDSDLLVNAAIAELRTEQFGLERAQIRKAATLLDTALTMKPADPRPRFFRALVRRAEGQPREAADELSKLATEYPRDRELRRQLGQTEYLLGRLPEARAAFEAILAVDPNDAGAYQFLSPIYAAEGRVEDAERAHQLYLLWRDDPLADVIAARFFARFPQWAEERVWSHAHAPDSPPRPTQTGHLAAPER